MFLLENQCTSWLSVAAKQINENYVVLHSQLMCHFDSCAYNVECCMYKAIPVSYKGFMLHIYTNRIVSLQDS